MGAGAGCMKYVNGSTTKRCPSYATPKGPIYRCIERHPATRPDTPIYRHALGRIAKLGDLYDATTDNFCKISVFRQLLPPNSPAISKTDNLYNDKRFASVNSLEEKFRQLKVTGELQLSVLAGMCELGGSAEYLRQKMDGCGTAVCTQIRRIKTATERLEVSHDQVKNNISENAIRHPRATHVVIEIEWGADYVITGREEKRIIENNKKTQRKVTETEKKTETLVEIFGDVLPSILPRTLDDAQKMMEKIPERIEKCNDGKGRPLTYVMIPTFDLDRQLSDTPRQSIRTFISIDEDRTMNIVRLFDHATQLRQKVQKGMGSEADDSFEVHEAWAKYKLCRRVEKVRSGRKSVECLDRFCDRYSALLKSTMDRRGIHGDESWQEHSSSKYVSSDEVEFSSI